MPKNISRTKAMTVTPTISTSAYAAGDAIGGKLTFDGAGGPGGGGVIQSVVIIDHDGEAAELDLVLFDQDFTPSADNAVFAPSAADLAHCIGTVTVSRYQSFSSNVVGQAVGLGHAFRCDPVSGSLYGQLVSRGTPTYTATTDLTVKLIILQD